MNTTIKRHVLLILFCVTAILIPQRAFASEGEFNTRTQSEVNEVCRDLVQLFPSEFHYVREYEEKQIDKDVVNPTIIFEDTRSTGEKNYTLTVYNNRQVLVAIEKDISKSSNILRANDAYQVTKSYQLGDIGHYNTFTVTYTVNRYSYDVINSWSVSGSGFYLFPYNYRHKDYEDSSGNAYRAYVNSSMNYNGSGVLYDLGVVVGHDSSKGVCRLSTGADAFITYLLNPFIWG